MARLGLDFGTSNTAAGVMAGSRPFAIPLEPEASTLPTAVFIDFSTRKYTYGSAAARAMMDGADGRFLRALKSILGTPLAREQRRFLNERVSLIEIIARFLTEIRLRSESFTGLKFETALSGRPVHFHSASAERDQQAELDLREAYMHAGFKDVTFLPEPEAAALSVAAKGRILIVDIGGGTSDFTLCDRKGEATQILASRGLRIGGTDFDRALNLDKVMPLLGYEAKIGAELGDKTHTAPRAMFHDLASWEKIAFVYDPALLREVRRWERLAADPVLFERLGEVLEAHLGHDIAYAVEAGKIAANMSAQGLIDLGIVERGLESLLLPSEMDKALAVFADRIGEDALRTVADAGCSADSVGTVVFVGGSSLMRVIRAKLAACFPNAAQQDAEVFTAVVHGLAIAAD